jgi:hypothetical protein
MNFSAIFLVLIPNEGEYILHVQQKFEEKFKRGVLPFRKTSRKGEEMVECMYKNTERIGRYEKSLDFFNGYGAADNIPHQRVCRR